MSKGSSDSALLALVGEVMGLLDLDEFRRGLLSALTNAVPAKYAGLNEIGPDYVVALVEPPLEEVWYDRFAALLHENPLYQRHLRTRDARAYRFSDVTTRRELEATRLYREFYEPLGVKHQIAFTLPTGAGHVVAVSLSRGDPDYTDAERDLLNDARPYLIQAYRNAIAYSTDRESPRRLRAALLGAGLTPRESEVVRLVALGRSNRHAAEALGLSERTVQKHLENAFRKLDVTSRSQAAARAWELSTSIGFDGDVGPLRLPQASA